MNLENIVLLSDYAMRHGLDYKKLRRMARKDEFEQPFKFGSDWMIDADVTPPVIPERKTRTRVDGRSRFVVYINRETDEQRRIADIVGTENIVDLRNVRAARKFERLARETANATGDANDDVDANGEYVKMQRAIAADAGIDV